MDAERCALCGGALWAQVLNGDAQLPDGSLFSFVLRSSLQAPTRPAPRTAGMLPRAARLLAPAPARSGARLTRGGAQGGRGRGAHLPRPGAPRVAGVAPPRLLASGTGSLLLARAHASPRPRVPAPPRPSLHGMTMLCDLENQGNRWQ